ncbi:MAG: HD domain-containing protein, partial [Betaproteobacteria bacterium]|nr:HD domain-containing protein [Betaproteobacteria bacterium]
MERPSCATSSECVRRVRNKSPSWFEDLVEAIALAHDLGHTPFGHAGQDALND